MRHRPVAGDMIDHTLVGLFSLMFAVVVGIAGALSSLLLRWPGLNRAGEFLQFAAQAHVPLLIFFTFVPAALGGLAVMRLPEQVGAERSAIPSLDIAAFGLTIIALVAFIGIPAAPTGVVLGGSALILTCAVVLHATSLIATMLIGRTLPYGNLPVSAWTTLIAATFTICAAPIAAASVTSALWHGVSPWNASAGLVWPALCLVLVLVLGWVSDIFRSASHRHGSVLRALIVLLACEVLGLFMAWAFCVENRVRVALPAAMIEGVSLLLVFPFELMWSFLLIRSPRMLATGQLPIRFATGFAVMLPVGLLADLFGSGEHEAVSLALAFAVLAGFFQLTGQVGQRSATIWAAKAQFWLLLGGSLILVLPAPAGLKALGAAMSSLSIGLFAIHLGLALRPGSSVMQGRTGVFLAAGRRGL